MPSKIKVIQYGCGPVGCSIVRLALRKQSIEVVGAIDIVNVGQDLGEVAGIGRKLGVSISGDVAILNRAKPDIVLHATDSVLEDVYPQFETVIKSGINVVSTNEQLSYPFRKQGRLAAKIDKLAKEHAVTILGTGVNPGFVMDTLPLAMTGICHDVKHIKVVRVQDASHRRLPFQKKIGAGKTIEEFDKLVEAQTLRHVGLEESIAMIADGLGWELDDITEMIEPIFAETEVRTKFISVKQGQVAGVRQVARGLRNGSELIMHDFQAYIGAKESFDAVYITGEPDMEIIVKGGIPGDIATAGMVVNSIPRVLDAQPGLMTMKDLPLVYASPSL